MALLSWVVILFFALAFSFNTTESSTENSLVGSNTADTTEDPHATADSHGGSHTTHDPHGDGVDHGGTHGGHHETEDGALVCLFLILA
jgi:hypothetical protein